MSLPPHAFMQNRPIHLIPDPPVKNLYTQGQPIPNPQVRYASQISSLVMTGALVHNPLPFERFTGIPTLHPNRPQFLSVNDQFW